MPAAVRTAFAQAWLLETTASTPSTGFRARQASGIKGSSHSWWRVARGTRWRKDGRAFRNTSGTRAGSIMVVSSSASAKAASSSSTTRSDPAYRTSHSWAIAIRMREETRLSRMAPRTLLLALAAVACLSVSGGKTVDEAQTATARGKTLRVLRSNPRYFTDGSGRAVYLTGSHVWWNLLGTNTWRVDCERGKAAPFDYGAYLDSLVRHHHNFIRLWTIELTTWRECGDKVTVVPQPWRRTGPGKAFDGLPKFDLRRHNAAYFRRLRSRVLAARRRGLYVSVMLFEGWGEQFQPQPWRGRSHPFHRGNNVNRVDPDLNRDGTLLELYTLGTPRARRIQEAYVRRVIDTVGDLDNVLYEIANESGAFSVPWQYRMIEVIRRHEARKRRRHPIGMTYVHGDPSGATLYRSKADWVSPHDPRHLTDPPPASARKVVVSDTDHHCGGCGDASFPWRTFMRGYNPIFMDEQTAEPRADEIRRAMGQTRRYAARIGLVAMRPRGDLCSTGYCLVRPGREYLVYQSTSGAFTVDLRRGAGRRFSVEWSHPVTGAVSRAEAVAGGSVATLRPPFRGPAVAYLRRR
jgi:hypothetical protein